MSKIKESWINAISTLLVSFGSYFLNEAWDHSRSYLKLCLNPLLRMWHNPTEIQEHTLRGTTRIWLTVVMQVQADNDCNPQVKWEIWEVVINRCWAGPQGGGGSSLSLTCPVPSNSSQYSHHAPLGHSSIESHGPQWSTAELCLWVGS